MHRVVASVLTFAFLASAAVGEDVFVLEKSRPVTIVLADSPTVAEQTAAKELDTYLSKMTGVPCVIVPEAKAANCAIYVGPTALAQQAGIDCRELDKEEWILRASDGNLIVAGGRPRGTLYGVYDLLERLGVTWPDVESECVPTLGRQAISWNVHAKPAIMNRCIYSGVGQSNATLRFLVRNKMNAQIHIPEEFGGCEPHGSPGGCHTFHAYTTKDWPDEWFALNKKGQRRCARPRVRGPHKSA